MKPKEYSVLLTEAPLNPKEDREEMTAIMFETFEVPSMYIANQAALSFFLTGRSTGIVLESGDGVTYAVPIIEQNPCPRAVAINRLEIAGMDLTEHLMKILGIWDSFARPLQKEVGRDIKEKLAYVAVNYEDEMKKAEMKKAGISSDIQKKYELPDGQNITVGSERFRCAEVLFQPQLMGKDCKGIHEIINDSINCCDRGIREELYRNIVLSGGSAMIDGFKERLTEEMTALAPIRVKPKVNLVAEPEREYSAWAGGSLLASLSTFEEMWITKDHYDESGLSIVHTMCPQSVFG